MCAISYKETACWNFRTDGSLLSINVLELKVILFGLKSLYSHLRQTCIKMLAEHTAAMCAINDMGGCKSLLCDQKMRRIWNLPIEKNISVTAAHISGIPKRGRPEIRNIRFKDRMEFT